VKKHWLTPEEIANLGEDEYIKPEKTADPVSKYKGMWYFWDETWSQTFGPFDTHQEAREGCRQYAEEL